uniref:Utp21 domain-containing protein n=1 Tax=Heterorhabditis bacteriophora TaxID=37862 RepID=A0A1I7XV80_HETBA
MRSDFELVQSYLATAIKIHRSQLWIGNSNNDSLLDILEELLSVEDEIWSNYDQVIVENSAVVQWIKNALL